MLYNSIFKRILFRLSPEVARYYALIVLKTLKKLPLGGRLLNLLYNHKSENLKTTVFGMEFKNPVGLAAGLDPDGQFCNEVSVLGFSFVDIGSITPLPEEGNPKPRFFPLMQDKALINRVGLCNKGVFHAIENLKKHKSRAIISANIAHNSSSHTLEAIKEDYCKAFSMLYDFADMFTVNISFNGDSSLTRHADGPETILDALLDIRICYDTYKPILVKVSPDMPFEELDKLLKYCMLSGIDGIVAGNATTCRDGLQTSADRLGRIGDGLLSGAPLFERNIALVRHVVEYTNDRIPVVACGGIMSPEQAQEMLDAGAALIEILTGVIFEGPSLVKKVLKHLDKVKPTEKKK